MILISIDGMRPDGVVNCGSPYVPQVCPIRGLFEQIHRAGGDCAIFCMGDMFTPGEEKRGVSILDLAPTIAKIMGVKSAREWEGKELI